MASFIGPYPINQKSIGPFPINIENQYNDLLMSVASARQPAANFPNWTQLTTNIYCYTFGVGDYVDFGSTEFLHGWDEGTEIEPHIHILTNGEEAVDTKVNYILYYNFASPTGPLSAEASATIETVIPANTPTKTHMLIDMKPAIVTTGYKIGTTFQSRLYRVAKTAGGANPAANPFVTMLGLHYSMNSLGSSTVRAK